MQSIDQPWFVEVHQQPDREATEAEICEQLRVMHGLDNRKRLDFDDELSRDDKVRSETIANR